MKASAHAWCLKAPSGKLWPAFCSLTSKRARENAVVFCPKLHKSHPTNWKGLYKQGFRVVRVFIKEYKPIIR